MNGGMGLGQSPGSDQHVFKVLFTAAVIAVVWFAFKGRGRVTQSGAHRIGRALGAARRAMAESARTRKQAGEGPAAGPLATVTAVELKPCPRCGTYIAVGTACTCTAK